MIAIINYNAGNIQSVANAVNRLGYDVITTDCPDELRKADKVIFPGVGEAKSAMCYLKEKQLDEIIRQLQQPVLGICLGMQLLCASTEEGNTKGIGIFQNEVKLFKGKELVPHMGWNDFELVGGELFKGINTNDNAYFVHSYYAEIGGFTTAICNYIQPFSAALEKDNFYATQFHPEKSSGIGSKILNNFLAL